MEVDLPEVPEMLEVPEVAVAKLEAFVEAELEVQLVPEVRVVRGSGH